MRKLDKTKILASVYKAWQDKLEEEAQNHPEYSSKNKFYLDVVANLLWIQDGLCAYTEQFLFEVSEVSPQNWQEGVYGKGKFEFYGHLEHYDESLKTTKGWLWSNLFVAHSDINSKNKGTKPVLYALKPDVDDYDPFFLLEYNFKEHRFIPNSNRDFSLQERILNDINVLGLNFGALVQDRKRQLNLLVEEVRLKQKTLAKARTDLKEFYTAFEMLVRDLGLE